MKSKPNSLGLLRMGLTFILRTFFSGKRRFFLLLPMVMFGLSLLTPANGNHQKFVPPVLNEPATIEPENPD